MSDCYRTQPFTGFPLVLVLFVLLVIVGCACATW
ncbi:YjcZ family sporulation protein [Bacillus shivajii]|nr:YjcZ family sporulation protein [Bacillus shivajii]UCZ54120.1 YjcZ family sporulation protein [Bacillus shivajii]